MSNQFENQPSVYDKESKVVDPEVARAGAEIENKYRKKILDIFKRSNSHIAEGELAAELAMEKTETMDKSDLPGIVFQEFYRYIKEIKRGNDGRVDPDDADDIEIDQVMVGDLGDGVKRYRLSCENIGIAGIISGITMPEHEKLVFIIDVKDESIINSDVIVD
jgi:hypothetical protein